MAEMRSLVLVSQIIPNTGGIASDFNNKAATIQHLRCCILSRKSETTTKSTRQIVEAG